MKNKKQSRNYSFVALIISLVALIATILLAITYGLASAQVFTVSSIANLKNAVWISAGVVILGVATYAILEPDRVRRFLTGRQAKYGSNAVIMSIAFLGILLVGNVLAFQNPVKPADLTEDNANTLSPELVAALKTLPQKVTATGFFSAQSSTQSAEELLTNIKSNSKGKFDYLFIDPDRDPQAAINAGITGDGKILLQMGTQKEIVAFASETEILKGLLRLLNPNSSAIYFLTGHGEHDVEQSGDASMTRARETLENKNYVVKTLNLLVDNQIPEDAGVIVIAGPIKPISQNEANLLNSFLDKGGSLVVMEDPPALTQFGDASDPLADILSKDWGISFNNDVVIDLNTAEPSVAAAASYDASHPVTRNMNALVTFFPFTRSLTLSQPPEGVTVTSLVQTNDRSWGETDFTSITQGGQVGHDDNETWGPLTLVAAGENAATKGRVVVFGTSNLAIDPYFDSYGNGDMFVNSIDWSAEQEDLANITPKTSIERSFVVPSQLRWIAILLGSIFIIPGLVVAGGISSWLARRRQG